MIESSLPALEIFLRQRLATSPLPGPSAQWRFAPRPPADGWTPDLSPETARPAAALILVYDNGHGPTIPLTVRHAGLPQHAGQVSLPGGAIDPGESIEAAALRESEEEIGVPGDQVRLLGRLSPLWIPVSNFLVQPVVGIVEGRPVFRLHPHEVSEILHAPIAELRDRSRLRWVTRDRNGVRLRYPSFDVGSHTVWGATATILGEFACLFDDTHGPNSPTDESTIGT